MGFECGLVGLPNVGKSTLFNALSNFMSSEVKIGVPAENYPFCTIDPHIASVPVPDERLDKLAHLASSQKCIPTKLSFVDIAGLVRNAHEGEGLGNSFLGRIREVDLIFHVVRCFDDTHIFHVEGNVDPLRDVQLIQLELIRADLQTARDQMSRLHKRRELPENQVLCATLAEAISLLNAEKNLISATWTPDQRKHLNHFLTIKPLCLIANVAETHLSGNHHTSTLQSWSATQGIPVFILASALEYDLAATKNSDDYANLLSAAELDTSRLMPLIQAGYKLLDLITFFTIGPQEARAWTLPHGRLAPEAAGVIHSDFQEGFIFAETISYHDFITYGGEAGSKSAGRMRLEGKHYAVQDGDILHFRFNVPRK